ncbi:PorP/SprF family type IX secretion system membrane protein [Pontibacter beigongshangensis]|uniref:PorP/SprF family type IX secretion system membrane protein n=1 Tax=Pontibacter beigongshangensis TaxID=2574733 RepID=UPI00164EE997|nr:type IX secretion system membrane protein PorP/SprF [Pontibacter beigongshangensis]
MIKIIRQILAFCGVLLAPVLYAQQAPQYTQYIFNEMVINPAYTGSKELLNINATHRSQWSGLEGSPTSQVLSVDGLTRNGRLGLGFSALNDEIGVQTQLNAYGNASVRLNLSETSRIAVGFAGGFAQYTLDGTKLRPGSTIIPDVAVPTGRESEILPDIRGGVFFNTERFYAGFSAANLVPFKGSNPLIGTPVRQYFLSSGYVFDLSSALRFKPSFLLQDDFKGPSKMDLNAFLMVYDRFWFGGSYRTAVPLFSKLPSDYNLQKRNAFAVIAQLFLTPSLRLGYSYDITLNDLREYPSHEVSVGYTFFKKQDTRTLSPRFF